MRIESIEAIAIDIPLTQNFGGATYNVLKRSTIVTRLRTESGLVSEIYNGDNRAHGLEICKLIHEVLAPAVKGMDIFATEAIWEKMNAFTIAYGDRKTWLEAIACVDCAIWDVMGKAVGRTVNELLGGYRKEVPIISIGGYYMDGKTLDDIGDEIRMYAQAEMAGCKFKVGGLSPEADAERVRAADSARGDNFMLCVDANRGWTAQQAIKFARLIEDLDIAWFEEPCHWYDDVAQMARVRQAIKFPTNAGQCEITSHGVRRLVDAGAVDYVNVDVSEAGGVTDWRRSAALCCAAGVEMAHHEESQIAQHLISAVPHGTYIECFAHPERDPVWQTMWTNRPKPKNGVVAVTTGPGFGLELDGDMIAKYRVN